MKPLTSPRRIGFAWYDRDNWERLREMSVDPEDLDSSFDEWEVSAIEAECELIALGQEVVRVPVTAEGLAAWCKATKRPLNRAARAAYVSQILTKQAPDGKV